MIQQASCHLWLHSSIWFFFKISVAIFEIELAVFKAFFVEAKRGTRFFILNDDTFYFSLMLGHHSAFLQEFRNWESAWAMQALHTVVYDLRTVAELVG
jgi:hypothetical protein